MSTMTYVDLHWVANLISEMSAEIVVFLTWLKSFGKAIWKNLLSTCFNRGRVDAIDFQIEKMMPQTPAV